MPIRKKAKIGALLLATGIAYAIIVRYTSFCIPCFFHTVTGLKCPGCGVTHLCLHLMRFEWQEAYLANRYLFATSPLLVLLLYLNVLCPEKIRTKNSIRILNNYLAIIYLIGLIAWGIVRNILSI